MDRNDLELWRAAARGDHAAFHALVDGHASSLFRVALSLCGNRPDAEDICQETFVAAFQGLRGFDGRSSVKTWLTRVLMRRSAKLRYTRRHERGTLSLNAPSNGDGHDAEGPLVVGLSVPAETGAVERRLDLLEMIRTLPAEFRDAIVLREVEGMSYQEIAEALGVPVGTVESRLYRGRAELRRKLSGYDPSHKGETPPRAAGRGREVPERLL